MKEYVIDTISKETLEEYGYDSSRVGDDVMKKIAENLRFTFRECVLCCLPQIADDYDIPLNKKDIFTVSRVYLSLNDEDGNVHDTKLFKNKEDAIAQLKRWRDDELELRKESEAGYEIIVDNEDRFRMAWDDEREFISIGID